MMDDSASRLGSFLATCEENGFRCAGDADASSASTLDYFAAAVVDDIIDDVDMQSWNARDVVDGDWFR